jgi:hypothetical protein
MNYKEYQELYTALLKLDGGFESVFIPIEQVPGESMGETLMRWLVQENLIVIKGNVFTIPDRDKIAEYDPNLLKLIDVVWRSGQMAQLDQMLEADLVFLTADEEGNIFYELTDAGKETME